MTTGNMIRFICILLLWVGLCALGACYETNLEGGENMSEEELREHGANQSLIHVDFMVGTEDLRIVGTTWDGEEITVFENGTWAF